MIKVDSPYSMREVVIFPPLEGFVQNALDATKAVVNTGLQSCKVVWHEGPLRLLQKACKVENYYYEAKLAYAITALIGLKQLEGLAQTFKMIQDLLLAAMVLDNFIVLVDSLKDCKLVWYKKVNAILRFTAAILDCAYIVEKYIGIKIPIYTHVREWMVSTLRQTLNHYFGPAVANSILVNFLVHLITKPKDVLILIECVLNIGVNLYYFFLGDEVQRNRVLHPREVLNFAGFIGKMVLILFGCNYYMNIVFRITAVVVATLAVMKQLLFK